MLYGSQSQIKYLLWTEKRPSCYFKQQNILDKGLSTEVGQSPVHIWVKVIVEIPKKQIRYCHHHVLCMNKQKILNLLVKMNNCECQTRQLKDKEKDKACTFSGNLT